jgi:hypothetical protein
VEAKLTVRPELVVALKLTDTADSGVVGIVRNAMA